MLTANGSTHHYTVPSTGNQSLCDYNNSSSIILDQRTIDFSVIQIIAGDIVSFDPIEMHQLSVHMYVASFCDTLCT